MLSDWSKASDAFQHAIILGDKSADIDESYGEMQVLAAAGVVSPAARDAFAAAIKVDPKCQVARYYLALADSQAGETQKAIAAWVALAAEIPEGSPMRAGIAQGVSSAARSAGIDAPSLPKGQPAAAEAPDAAGPSAQRPAAQGPAANGPTDDQVAAAAEMPPGDRERMIHGMIARLADRLRGNPGDLDGWLRLGRAYAVEGETDKAIDACDHAATLKPGDPAIKLQAASSLLSRLQPNDMPPPRAVALLQEAATAAPEAPEVLWYLGIVAAHEGNAVEARQDWTRLLQTLPKDGADYKAVQSALAELKAP
jgi:cytochrome c-type biogenesis protein CcmH